LNEQLEQALQSRIVIEQAKGITANAGAVSVDSAFGLIRRHARSQNANAEKRGRSDSPRRLQV
jgi:AmiR/NasT family two-component response regulator